MANELRHTPLYELHKKAGAKMVPFGGWAMPVSYGGGVLAEHKAVREACGLFDVSHMGEVMVEGSQAAAFLQHLTINNVNKLKVGDGQYTAMCNEMGGMIDDLILYRVGEEKFLMCINAANRKKDVQWVQERADRFVDLTTEDVSDSWAQLAIQGPKSQSALDALIGGPDKPRFEQLAYTGIMAIKMFGQDSYIARTGYTGEWGYEIYCPPTVAPKVWMALLETAHTSGCTPVGLGARDTLRLEACYLLYGNDMDETVSPVEAGISWAVDWQGDDFLGKVAIVPQKEAGPARRLVAFTMVDSGIPRGGMAVLAGDEEIGKVTSGSVLPSVGGAGGLALVKREFAKVDLDLAIDVRGKRKLARVAKKPLYTAKTKG